MEYFENIIEYPQDICSRILPWGERWDYISETFLNSFINYCKPIKAYMLDSYLGFDESVEISISVMEPPNSFNWVNREPKTKRELFELLTTEGSVAHTDIKEFQDDVLILAKIKEGEFMFFWFDCDVSDCSIGRFQTSDSEDEVMEEFERFLVSLEYDRHEIPVHSFRGWITW